MNQEDVDRQADQFPSPYRELFLYFRPIAHQALALVVLTFLACWGYAVNEYGWFLGMAFGWIPSAIIAAMLGGVCWWAFVYIPWESPGLLFLSIGVAIIVQLASFAILMGAVIWLGTWIWRLFQ